MTITTIIFDLDGVLVDFVDIQRKSFTTALNKYMKNNKLTYEEYDMHLDTYTSLDKLKICRKLFPEEEWDDKVVYTYKKGGLTLIKI